MLRADDVFGLAVMAYRCLTGSHPYIKEPGLSAAAQLRALSTAEIIDPVEHGVQLPTAVWRVLKGGLARDPGARPASALSFARALAEAVSPPEDDDLPENLEIDLEAFDGPMELGELGSSTEIGPVEDRGTLANLMENEPARVLVAVIAFLLITNLATLILLAGSDPQTAVPIMGPEEASWGLVSPEGQVTELEEAPMSLDSAEAVHYRVTLPGQQSALNLVWEPQEGLLLASEE